MTIKSALAYAFKMATVSNSKIKDWFGKGAKAPPPANPPSGGAKVVKPVDFPPKPPV